MIEIDQNERIIRVVHRHWFVLLGDIFVLIFAVAIPILLLFLLNILPVARILTFSGSPFAVGGFFVSAWLLIVWMLGWKMWTTYYLDVLIVTDKRIFDINQQGFFHRESGSFRIDRIQNITVDQKGIIQTLLDFGTIHIETAGESEEFVAPYIAGPYTIKKFINELQDQAIEKSQLVHFENDAPKPDISSNTTEGLQTAARAHSEGL